MRQWRRQSTSLIDQEPQHSPLYEAPATPANASLFKDPVAMFTSGITRLPQRLTHRERLLASLPDTCPGDQKNGMYKQVSP